MDWDDYRFFEALVRQGSVRGAAQHLGVNPSTVTRRLEHLEDALGLILFRRAGGGLQITTEGVDVAQRVEGIALEIRRLEETVKGRDQRLAGRVRVALPELLAESVLAARLASFAELYEEIQLELSVPRRGSVSRAKDTAMNLDVDVILEFTDQPDETMVGRPHAGMMFGVYGSSTRPEQVEGWVEWLAGDDMGRAVQAMQQRLFPGATVRLRCERLAWVARAIEQGVGLGILPCYLGDGYAGLQRLEHIEDQMGPQLWVLSHPYARSVQRLQIFLAYLRDVLSELDTEIFSAGGLEKQ
ncbi:MAG: LysR family transcriptional regulator [Pseudomonadota bacterium]